jgi:hypothetical protein
MQKFRICAGAVKVWSAKLLMGISWSTVVKQRVPRRSELGPGYLGGNMKPHPHRPALCCERDFSDGWQPSASSHAACA